METLTAMADLERLWAPWRSRFVSQRRRSRACIFCAAKRSGSDRAHHVIERNTAVFAMLNRYPYNAGHLLIAPYRHVGNLTALSPEEWMGMLRLTRRLMQRLHRAIRPQGFNVGFNLGRTAGAGVPGHTHLHIVPRWNGDTNVMPVLAHTHVMSHSLEEVYEALAARPRRKRR